MRGIIIVFRGRRPKGKMPSFRPTVVGKTIGCLFSACETMNTILPFFETLYSLLMPFKTFAHNRNTKAHHPSAKSLNSQAWLNILKIIP